jgi:hypothetical protein
MLLYIVEQLWSMYFIDLVQHPSLNHLLDFLVQRMHRRKLEVGSASSFSLVNFSVDMQLEHEFKHSLYKVCMQAFLIIEIPINFDAHYSCLIIHCASSFDSRTSKCRIVGLLNFDLCVHS